MPTSLPSLSEAELHGLVDGRVEADRRADVLRLLAASASDRALVEAWQEQNDLIRSAFRDVEREVLPVALDLAPPRLRCIDDVHRPLRAPRDRSEGRRNMLAAVTTLGVVATGLVGSWLMIAQAARDNDGPTPQPALESTLADRAAEAVGAAGSAVHPTGSFAPGLPAVRIPDLTNEGLALTSVTTETAEPASLVLRYRDGGDGRIVVSVARAPQDGAPTLPTPVGKGIAWRQRKAAFALAGTLPLDKLRAIAAALQDDAGRD